MMCADGFAAIPITALDPPHSAASPVVPALHGLAMNEISVDHHEWASAQCALLEKIFGNTRTYSQFKTQFQELLYKRRAGAQAGLDTETEGILLAGAPGGGKKWLLKNVVKSLPDVRRNATDRQLDIILVRVPGTGTHDPV
ncbi:MAG: hypothetical protein R8G34_18845 [Paracoccaceae bacterium]|nr:hypothetical protein [Paracoccaceae bacterium]